MAKQIYGETFPEIVEARIEKELKVDYWSWVCSYLFDFSQTG